MHQSATSAKSVNIQRVKPHQKDPTFTKEWLGPHSFKAQRKHCVGVYGLFNYIYIQDVLYNGSPNK